MIKLLLMFWRFMDNILSICLLFVCLGLYGIIFHHEAHAKLGGPVESIASDSRHLSQAAKQTTRFHACYTAYEIDSPSSTVREYVSLSGIVFAVAWNGMTHPDLSQLLGSYNKQFQEALRKTPRVHGVRRRRVKAPDLVVETWGHMRNLQGRAYDPALIPPCVEIDEIR
jgi:hypothetical protein